MAQHTQEEIDVIREADAALTKCAIQYQEIARWAHMLMDHCRSRGHRESAIELQSKSADWSMLAASYVEMIELNKEDLGDAR